LPETGIPFPVLNGCADSKSLISNNTPVNNNRMKKFVGTKMQKVYDVSANTEGYLVDFCTNKIIFITYSQTFATCHLRVYFAEV
jgi:hypothetical protein